MTAIQQEKVRWWPEPRLGFRVALAALYLAVAVGMYFTDRGLAVSIAGVVEFCWLGAWALVPWGQRLAWARRHPVLDSTIVFPSTFVALAVLTHLSIGVCALLTVPFGILLVAVSVLTRRRRGSV